MYNLLTLLIMNHGCNLIVSPINIFHASLRNLGMGAWARTLKLCKVFTKVGWGPWLKRKLCLGPASVINCTALSTLSFWVSLLPGAFGYNIWCIGRETLHFEETVLLGATLRTCGSDLHPSGKVPLLNAQNFHAGGYWMAAGRRFPPSRVEEGAWSTPWKGIGSTQTRLSQRGGIRIVLG